MWRRCAPSSATRASCRPSAGSGTGCGSTEPAGTAMRRRLVITYLVLLTLVLAALEVPLAVTIARRGTEEVVVERLLDANRFAANAEPALRDAETVDLAATLARYY